MAVRQDFNPNIGPKIWWNGELIDASSARIHISAHSLHYGCGVFEGIRAYELSSSGLGIFRGRDHMKRFNQSAQIAGLPTPYSVESLLEACKEVARSSGFGNCYLRPIAFLDAGPLGVAFDENTHPFTTAIFSMNWGKYLGDEAVENGANIKISSFNRHHPNVAMTKAKITGNYVNSVMAKMEAKKLGFDEAILLDPEGYIAEGSGENIFVIRNGKVITPSVESVLAGITRDTVIRILEEMKLPIQERRLSRDELYAADEVFFCGTAAEVTPISRIDMRPIGTGKPGEISVEVLKRYSSIVRGEVQTYSHWIDFV